MAEDGVLHLDGRHVLTAGNDDVLLAIADGDVVVIVEDATITGVEPFDTVRVVARRMNGIRGRFRLIPVTLHDHVAASEHLALR